MRIRLVVLVSVLLGSPVTSAVTGLGKSSQGSCLANISEGAIQGSDLGGSCAFLGIPFAASTAGANRWRPPQPRAPWTPDLLTATTAPSSCPLVQPTGALAGDEDCLKLNVWVTDPPPTAPAPVIVWLHTGGFAAASASFPSHNGSRLAEETGVVVVAPQYRLGPFGFLAHTALADEDPLHPTSGNYGLLDQRAALVWVRDHIAAFGGDPDNVTLAGTSAGGDSVGLQMVMPGAAGLFHRAVIESGTPTVRWPTHTEAAQQGNLLADRLGCTDPAQVGSCLRAATRDQILLALTQASQQVAEPLNRFYWLPVVDGVELPDQPRALLEQAAFHRMPTMIGTTRDEGWGAFITRSFPAGVSAAKYEAWVTGEFGAAAAEILSSYPPADFPAPAEAMARVVADAQFVCEGRRLARLIERTKTPTFVYSYEYEIDGLSLDHVIHGVESNILFGNPYVPPQFTSHVLDTADLALHHAMAGYWTRFATTGSPNIDDPAVVHWPAFTHPVGQGRGSDKYLVLDAVIREGLRLREGACDRLEPDSFRSILAGVPAAAP
jgi:para-nitrobenzyl esterase